MGGDDVRRRVFQLREYARALPEEVRVDILSLGVEAVAPLGVLLEREGPECLHAARLLLRLRAPEALAPLVRRLMSSRPGQVLYDVLLHGLEGLGPAVALEALEALGRARDADARFGLRCLLAHCAARDERIYGALVEQLQEEPIPAAANLADYGDPRALEPLTRTLAAQGAWEDGEEDLFARQTVLSLEDAILRLGGRLPGRG